MAYDLLITNGTVVDGNGGPRFKADVAVLAEVLSDSRTFIGLSDASAHLDMLYRDGRHTGALRGPCSAHPEWRAYASAQTAFRIAPKFAPGLEP